MITKVKYHYYRTNPYRKKEKSVLFAKVRYNSWNHDLETRKRILEQISFDFESPLIKYLESQGIKMTDSDVSSAKFEGIGRKARLCYPWIGIGLNIRVKAYSDIPKDRLFDLENLDLFIMQAVFQTQS